MKKVNNLFRLLSVMLAVLMVVTSLSVVAFADDSGAVAENSATGATYTTLADAFDAANAGETIILLTDVDDTANAATEVSYGVKFDLNGNSVAASNFLSFGDVVDTSADTTGAIVISNDITEAFTVFQTDNEYLPVYDTANGCYRFFDYVVKTLGSQYDASKDSLKFGFEIRLGSKKAYELISADPSVMNLVLDLEVKDNSSAGQKYRYTCDEALIKKYADTVIKNYELFATKSIAFTFSTVGVSRLKSGASYSATPVLSSPSTRVEKVGNTKTFTKA